MHGSLDLEENDEEISAACNSEWERSNKRAIYGETENNGYLKFLKCIIIISQHSFFIIYPYPRLLDLVSDFLENKKYIYNIYYSICKTFFVQPFRFLEISSV